MNIFNYKMHELSITRADISVCKLSFHLSKYLSSCLHVVDICCKALKLLGFIQRIAHDTIRFTEMLYSDLVRLVLDYLGALTLQ